MKAIQYIRGILNALRGAEYTTQRPHIQQGYQSVRFDASPSQRKEIVRRCRNSEQNSTLMQRLCNVFETYTVGAGVPLTPNSSDSEWNKRAKESWDTFCKFPVVDSRESFSIFQSKGARRWFIDGETFILLTNGESGKPRIQLVETHRINTPPDFAKMEGKTVIDGVSINPNNGRPLGYFIGTEDEYGRLTYSPSPTSAEFVVPICEPSRAAEYRCLPFGHACINEMQDYDTLHTYEMKAAKINADFALAIETADGEMPRGLFHGRLNSAVSGVTGAGTATTADRKEYYRSATGGLALAITRGDKLIQNPGQRPSVVTQDYWRTLRVEICNAWDIPYLLAYPESIQGTVARLTANMAATSFCARFLTLATAWERVYEYYMRWAKVNDPTLRGAPADWFKVTIQPPRSPSVDLGYESAANIAELDAGLANWETILAPRSLNADEVLRKKAEFVFKIKSLAREFSRDGIEVKPEEIAASKLTVPPAAEPQPKEMEDEMA